MRMAIKQNVLLCSLALFGSNVVLAEEVMVVTASGFEQQLKDAPASISVISGESLQKKPFRDVTDALKSIPGVTISGGGDKTDISLRGMDAKYTLILVDGKRVRSREARPNSDNAGFEQGWLPPLSAIERIEVVRGPMSSLYGSDAMGGVINIITKQPTNQWQGNLRLETILQQHHTAKNSYNTGFSVMGPLLDDQLSLQLYGQYADRAEDHYVSGHPKQQLGSINGKLTFTPNSTQTFELDYGHSRQESYSSLGKTRSPTAKSDTERDNRRDTVSLTHQANWGTLSSKTSAAYATTNNRVREMKIANSDVDTQFLLPLDNHQLTFGGSYSYQQLHDNQNKLQPSVTQISRWDYALYLEDEWRLFDNFALTGGLRFNYDELYGDHWNPRLYAVWELDSNLTLKGGISTGYTTPSLRYVVADWGQGTGGGRRNGVIIGNPDLAPEKSTNYEISLNYADEQDLTASATLFYTRFRDKIQSYYICDDTSNRGSCVIHAVSGFDFVQSRENIDRAEIKGFELSLTLPVTQSVKWTSNYTYMHAVQKSGVNDGLALNRTPRHRVNSQLDWQLNDQFSVWGKVAYTGEEFEAGKNGVAGTRYPGYTLWDLGVAWHINAKTTLYSGIYNLFDKEVTEDSFGKSLDGRRFWLGLDLNF